MTARPKVTDTSSSAALPLGKGIPLPWDPASSSVICYGLLSDLESFLLFLTLSRVRLVDKISTLEINSSNMTRSVPPGLAPVVERLELDQPALVTLKQLARIVGKVGIGTAPELVAHRLRARGWLLPTGLSGVWEFAPAAHAGPHSRGGPLLPVAAAFALRPDLRAAVALGSAAWAHGLSDRAPARVSVAAAPEARLPQGLKRRVDVVRFASRLPPAQKKGVPVQRLETLLVHLAARPTHMSSWGEVAEWLADIVADAETSDVITELEGRPRSVTIRLAYLTQGVWPELAERTGARPSSRVWFGPRQKLRRHSQQWRVADTLLPFDPAKLPPARSS